MGDWKQSFFLIYFMEREKTKISEKEFDDTIYEGSSIIWEEMYRETNYVDLNKGYEDIKIILKRIIDGRFFKFEYSDGGSEGIFTDFPIEGEEVFPKEKTITIYE